MAIIVMPFYLKNGFKIMPQFILNKAETRGKRWFWNTLNDTARGYIEAMFFTNCDTGDDNENLANDLGVDRLTFDSLRNIKARCDDFLSCVMPDGRTVEAWLKDEPDYSLNRAGNDLWYNQQGHGCGFWDRTELGDRANAYDKVCREHFSQIDVEIYRGWIHHC